MAKDIPIKTNAPVLAEAYATCECKLVEDRQFGFHQLLVGEKAAAHWLAGGFEQNGSQHMKTVGPAFCLGGET